MRFQILHESPGRVRLRALQCAMSMDEANLLEAWILALPGVDQVTVHERICGVTILFRGERDVLYGSLSRFSYAEAGEEVHILSPHSRQINREYKEKLVFQVLRHYGKKLFLPSPLRQIVNTVNAIPRIWLAAKTLLRGRLTVDVLDGVAIGVSLLTGDFSTAGSVRFLLSLGETLDDWTHKKSVDDLARSMSLQVDQVWLLTEDGTQVIVPLPRIQAGDRIVVHTGHVLPLDGILEQGDVMLNQASLTGESVPVAKRPGAAVYAGSVVEEGSCVLRVTHSAGENRYDRIVRMIEESERLKSGSEDRAYRLADRLVPWCLGGSALTWLLTGNTQRAVSVLMVDFSCAFYCAGTMDALTAVVMVVSAFIIYASLETAGNYSALLRVVKVSVNRAQEILDSPQMDIAGEMIQPDKRDVCADKVEFSYEKRKVIDGISVQIPEKTTTAIVGPSGGGKTTLVNLLARFWDVDAGAVTLGGRNVKDYDMDSLMENFSFVFQNVYLFHDTIANNIRFGHPEASMEAVISAAKKACCHDFISALPDGYDTVIGEGGASLSGGEKQRISIARAMMKDAPVIFLDEATANVDPENENELMRAIQALTAEKTVIMIAHRLKTVEHADQILVIDHGRIVQQGTHETLMAEEGIYKAFIGERREAASWKLLNC